jgi:hypothetical protein
LIQAPKSRRESLFNLERDAGEHAPMRGQYAGEAQLARDQLAELLRGVVRRPLSGAKGVEGDGSARMRELPRDVREALGYAE